MELNVALVPVVRILMNSTMLINQLLLDPSCFHYSLLVHGCPCHAIHRAWCEDVTVYSFRIAQSDVGRFSLAYFLI